MRHCKRDFNPCGELSLLALASIQENINLKSALDSGTESFPKSVYQSTTKVRTSLFVTWYNEALKNRS